MANVVYSLVLLLTQCVCEGVHVLWYSSLGPDRADCVLAVVFLLLSYRCIVTVNVALPHGAVGWSAVWVVAFPDNTHLLLMAVNVWYGKVG